MDIKKHLTQYHLLAVELGEDRLKKITDEVASILIKNKLDATPSILEDFLEYVRYDIILRGI